MRRRVSFFVALFLLGLCASCGGDPAPLGGRCRTGADCVSRSCNTSGDFPGGVCTQPCDRTSDCPAGFACVSNSSGICLQACAVPSDCAAYGAQWTCREQSVETSSGGPSGKVLVCSGR